jgi:hypothetical protein
MRNTLRTEDHIVRVLTEPSLHSTNLKIAAWLLGCVLIGIALSVLYPDFDEEKINRNSGRRIRIECRRRARVEEVEEENCLVH